MQRKFRSLQAAQRFARTTKMKVKRGKATKLKDGTKAHWFTLTKSAKKRRR